MLKPGDSAPLNETVAIMAQALLTAKISPALLISILWMFPELSTRIQGSPS
jgi:hypothetical protein